MEAKTSPDQQKTVVRGIKKGGLGVLNIWQIING